MQKPEYAPKDQSVHPVVGWAVIDNGQIKIRTVSDTKRAAMVNWLVTERSCMIYNAMTDDQIEWLWFQYRVGAEIEYVTITLGTAH